MMRGAVPFLLVFLTDLIWMLLVGAVFSVWVYRVNDGRFRWFIAAGAAAGFAVWHATLGRLVLAFAEAVAAFVRRLLRLLVLTPLLWIARGAGVCARFLWRATGGRVLAAGKRIRAIRHTERIRRAFGQDISFGDRGERT